MKHSRVVLEIAALFEGEYDVPDFFIVSSQLFHVMASTLDEVSSLDKVRHHFEYSIFPKLE